MTMKEMAVILARLVICSESISIVYIFDFDSIALIKIYFESISIIDKIQLSQ